MKQWISFQKNKVRISRPLRKILLGTGIAFFSTVFVIGLLTLFYFGIRIVLVWIHIIQTRVPEYPHREVSYEVPLGYTFNSFSDLFSGEGRVSLEKSSGVYWGSNETAFMSPPVYEWRQTGSKDTKTSTSCIGTVCVEQEGTNILLNGERITLPLSSSTLSVSSAGISDMFVVGQVVSEGSAYRGYIYTLSPQGDLQEVFSFSSQYEGVLGIGGEGNTYVVVYGAYEGKGWYVSGTSVTDISHLLSFRVMNGGFIPHVYKGERGWYIISEDDLNPKLIKLFGEDIPYGVIDFSPLLFTENIRKVSLVSFNDSSFIFFSSYTNEMWEFVDQGFSLEDVEIISENINVSFDPIVYVVLQDSVIQGERDYTVSIATDQREWKRINQREIIPLSSSHLFWKVELTPQRPFFFDKIQFDYWTE